MKQHFFPKTRVSVILLSLVLLLFSNQAMAVIYELDGLTIAKIRAVGTYSDPTYNTTVELWFATTLNWPSGVVCQNFRVEIDATQRHLVAAAYLAMSTGKQVNIVVDTALPIRGTMCQISYLDVLS